MNYLDKTRIFLSHLLNFFVKIPISREMKKDLRHRQILVLDEDPETLELMMEPLRWEGHDVRGLTSPNEVSEFLTYWKPQLIIVDPDFANSDGLEVLKFINANGMLMLERKRLVL